ncbi:HotDog domain-containing protein [Zychaea mexicana]|uniref:HotDog domain-containing protein n=1 Tax=Zychaea mexicana TaxID=64656 RepID=UPI0022FE2346|nr:HotDog domain-containing protein [Zychaea mexicana]KAI9496178.1 HotDog domain-containing protein [Zychaea mexicana]
MKINPEIAKSFPDLYESALKYEERGRKNKLWQEQVQNELTLVGAEPNKVTWEFEIAEKHCNLIGNFHGGCVATVIDVCSSFAILTNQGKHKWQFVGVSTGLSVAYLNGMSPGQVARIECEVQHVGKSVGSVFTRVYNKEDNRLCYTSTHGKYRIDARL